MDVRRLLTARPLGGLALLIAVAIVATGLVGFATSASGSPVWILLPAGAALALLAVVVWDGWAGSRGVRTPYW